MKSFYESLVDWKLKTDYLWCSPNFHGRVHYDCVIVHGVNHDFFAWLLFIFTYKLGEHDLPFALIQPFADVHHQHKRCKKDQELCFHWLWAKNQGHSVFINLKSIFCGAFLVPALDRQDEYIIVDVVDTDMFLQIQNMYPEVWITFPLVLLFTF